MRMENVNERHRSDTKRHKQRKGIFNLLDIGSITEAQPFMLRKALVSMPLKQFYCESVF